MTNRSVAQSSSHTRKAYSHHQVDLQSKGYCAVLSFFKARQIELGRRRSCNKSISYQWVTYTNNTNTTQMENYLLGQNIEHLWIENCRVRATDLYPTGPEFKYYNSHTCGIMVCNFTLVCTLKLLLCSRPPVLPSPRYQHGGGLFSTSNKKRPNLASHLVIIMGSKSLTCIVLLRKPL